MVKLCSILLTTCLMTTGCASFAPKKSEEPKKGEEEKGVSDFRVWMDNGCKFTKLQDDEKVKTDEAGPLLLALAGAVAPKIIEHVVDAGAGYLEKKKENLVASYSSRGSGEFFKIFNAKKPQFYISCISMARGGFGDPLVDKDAGKWAKVKLDSMHLTGIPSFYGDLHLQYSSDGTAFQIRPRYIELNKTAAKRIGKDRKKDILITGYFEAPHLSVDDASSNRFGSFQLKIPAVGEGKSLGKAEMENIMTQWIPVPAIPTLTTKNKDGQDEPKYGYLPFTLFITVQESEDAGDILLGAAKIAADSKADITKAISDAVAEKLKKDDKKKSGTDGN